MLKTEIKKIDPQNPDPEILEEAIQIIKNGGLVGLPTDTVYALGADAFNREAVDKIYKIKKRDKKKPIAVFINDPEKVEEYVDKISLAGRLMIEKFWPGALTLVFKSSDDRFSHLMGGTSRLGIRISPNKLLFSIVEKTGVPIPSTSANVSGRRILATASGVRYYFNGRMELILDAGKSPERFPSTVVDISSDQIFLNRPGALRLERIRKVFPQIKILRKS